MAAHFVARLAPTFGAAYGWGGCRPQPRARRWPDRACRRAASTPRPWLERLPDRGIFGTEHPRGESAQPVALHERELRAEAAGVLQKDPLERATHREKAVSDVVLIIPAHPAAVALDHAQRPAVAQLRAVRARQLRRDALLVRRVPVLRAERDADRELLGRHVFEE